MKILIITNHKTHIEQDSFYDIVSEIYESKYFKDVSIASVGLKENLLFYETLSNDIYVNKIKSYISFGYNWNGNLIKTNFNQYDIILLRIDQPVSEKFLSQLKNKNKKAIYINDPIGMIKTNSKKYLLNFKKSTSNVQIVDNLNEIIEISYSKNIVIKPLKSYGGQGISKIYNNSFYIENKEVSLKSFSEHVLKLIKKDKEVLVMDYLNNVHKGDKRIIIFNGIIIGSILRVPTNNSWICNALQGAKSEKTIATKEEKEIIKKINNVLKKEGILLYGIDTLENNDGKRILSEINTANVGGFSVMEKIYVKPYIKFFVKLLIKYLNKNYNKVYKLNNKRASKYKYSKRLKIGVR